MLERLKKDVCKANLDLVKNGLVIHTWGNASGIDRKRGLMAIKPSGILGIPNIPPTPFWASLEIKC